MSQQLINLLDVLANEAAWDAVVIANFQALRAALLTIKTTIQTQGSAGAPSVIRFQLQDSNGVNVVRQFFLRLRLSASNTGYPPLGADGTKTMIVSSGSLAETIIASRDLIFQANTSGYIEVTVTYPVAGTFHIVCGHGTLEDFLGNANNFQTVVHV